MSKSADAFRTISEVADWLGVQTHVLRFWESKFTQIKPIKRAGGRRYYRPADMLLLGGIRKLLHDDGLTIKGVQKLLREEGMAHVSDMSAPLDDETAAQIDGDLAPDAGFIEAELAPASTENTVTPFAPVSKPETEALPEPPEAKTTPQPEPEPVPAPSTLSEPASEQPPLNTTTTEPTPPALEVEAVDPAEAGYVPEEPVAAGMETPPTPAETNDKEDTEAPEPVFARAPDAAPTEPPAEESAPVGLPSFLTARAEDTPPKADEASPTAESAPEPVKLRPRIVEVPDEVPAESLEVAPSALGKAGRVTQLTPAQRSAVRPLLARLTALRDQMAGAGRDPR